MVKVIFLLIIQHLQEQLVLQKKEHKIEDHIGLKSIQQILYGWRLDRESNYGNLIQVRLAEKAVLPDGQFGEKVFDQIRVIEPGRYRVFRKKEQIEEMYDVSDNSVTGSFEAGSADKDYRQVESGSFSLGEIPLVTIYSGKTDNLVSKPPLLGYCIPKSCTFSKTSRFNS